MGKINVFSILIAFGLFFTGSAYADVKTVDANRIKYLLKQASLYQHDGPNCFASTLFAKGFIDDASYLSSASVDSVIQSPYCKTVESYQDVTEGDLILIGGKAVERSQKWTHGILSLNKSLVFAKMGFRPEEPTKITSRSENIAWYIAQDASQAGQICSKNFSNPKSELWCQQNSLYPSYFRCDLNLLRQDIEKSPLAEDWKAILDIRKKLFLETFQSEKTDHEGISKKLKSIEIKILQKKRVFYKEKIILNLMKDTHEQIHSLETYTVY